MQRHKPTASNNVTVKDLEALISVARGDRSGQLLLRDGNLVNVFTGEIERTNIVIEKGLVAAVRPDCENARETIDVNGRYVVPGFIDGHIHVESSMLPIHEFVRLALIHGTTTVLADPHEIANVLGVAGIRYMLRASAGMPMDFFLTIPSCVPSTHMETSGARLTSLDIIELSKLDRVFGLGEMMDYFSVISGSEHVLRSLVVARQAGLPIDGHAPGFVGRLLQAYAAAGISSDHECVSIQEVVEKLKAGMNVMIREGSAAKNLATLLPAVTDFNLRRFCLVTDDKYPEELLREGYLDSTLSKAVVHGLKPAAAIQMVTLNPAEHYGLLRRGAVAPGYLADLVVLDDLKRFKVRTVIKNGVPVVRNGEMLKDLPSVEDRRVLDTVDIRHLSIRSFAIKADGTLCRVIQLVPNQILTRQQLIHPTVERGYVKADPTRDLLKLAVVERHHASGRIGLGLVSGFNLKQGALGTTVAHDSHNIIIVGTNDRDMLEVANQLKRMGGGYVAVAGEAVVSLRLPVAGLMSLQNAEKVANDQRRLLEVSKSWGSQLPNPLTALSFLALPVIPELRLTDKGLVDVRKSRMASLFVWN